MNKQFRPEDLAVRPFFRVLGALLFAFLIFLFVTQGIPLFQADSIAPEVCKPNKHKLLCELGNLVLDVTPNTLQGPLAATAHIAFAFILACGIWLLVKPLIRRPQ
jgi:hypothetical protein